MGLLVGHTPDIEYILNWTERDEVCSFIQHNECLITSRVCFTRKLKCNTRDVVKSVGPTIKRLTSLVD